jgi:phage baseplate assembly protein W
MSSIRIPFSFDGGRTSTVTSDDTIAQQKILDAMTTGKYERVMRHNYGMGIERLVFDIIDELTLSDFKVDAIQDINAVLSRAQILDIRVSPSTSIAPFGNTESTVALTVVYRLPLGATRVLNFSVAVPGNLNEDTPV